MATHSHNFDGRWPFHEAENTTVFCCEHVVSGDPVLYVVHDHDGDWQFLCGGSHEGGKPNIVCLGCMVEKDSSIWTLADMPIGWGAERESAGDSWNLEANAEPGEYETNDA
jgi:hypothetical protein